MGKFDPIDIFFIALISTYFITLICIGLTFLFMRLSKRKKPIKVEIAKEVIEEPVKFKEEKIKKEFNFKDKMASIPLFRKLFMKEVKHVELETKVLDVEKVKVGKTAKIEPTIVENTESKVIDEKEEVKEEKKTTSSKPKTSTTRKTTTKKTESSSKPKSTTKSTTKASTTKKSNTSKTNTNKSNTSKTGTKKSTSSKSTNKKPASTKKKTSSSKKSTSSNKKSSKKK